MSASLVGSEMCIRDSGSLPFPGVSATAQRAAGGASRGGCSCARGSSWTCLLYTSDAADDM
eukprot:568742-Alexandrium_andersonii.AAC.1